MSLKTPLLTFDFEKQPFDGDPRQAHQFIPFLLGKLGASQLSYILNVQQYPDPQITEYALLKEQEHASDQAIAAVEFKEAMDTYTHQMLARELEINHIRRTVADPQERANQISAKIAPTMPKLRDVASLGSTAHDLGKTRELIRKYDIAADQALQIIKSFLSPRLLNMCSPIFHDAAHPSRAKLLKIWEWLQSQRSLNAQVIGEIKKDITMLPEITNFAEAINIISAMNQLQSELITLHAPLSDIELIIIHTNKLNASPEFLQLKLEYLQRASDRNADLPPAFDREATIQPPPPPPTWSDYCFSVHKNARASNNTNRTTTVLQAVTASPPSDDHHAFASGRAYPSSQKSHYRFSDRTSSGKPPGHRTSFGNKQTGPITPGAKRDRDRASPAEPPPKRLSPTQWARFLEERDRARKAAEAAVRKKFFPELQSRRAPPASPRPRAQVNVAASEDAPADIDDLVFPDHNDDADAGDEYTDDEYLAMMVAQGQFDNEVADFIALPDTDDMAAPK